jgi:hypothetical protein
LFSPPFSRLDEYTVTEVKACAYTFTADRRFFSKRFGNTRVVSACSGHGYKFGAAVGRRVAQALDTDDDVMLARWLRGKRFRVPLSSHKRACFSGMCLIDRVNIHSTSRARSPDSWLQILVAVWR